jgi:hypothetical protein
MSKMNNSTYLDATGPKRDEILEGWRILFDKYN